MIAADDNMNFQLTPISRVNVFVYISIERKLLEHERKKGRGEKIYIAPFCGKFNDHGV